MNLSNKYRPVKFDTIIGQEDTIHILQSQVKAKQVGATYLFAGASGSGKTTTARVLAMAVNCEHPRQGNPCLRCESCQSIIRGTSLDVMELDIGSYRGIDDIKHLESMSRYMPFGSRKVYIMDEVHALTAPAWDAMLKMLENCHSGMLFILCTTDIGKVPETARSRCQLFTFHRVEVKDIVSKLEMISDRERLKLGRTSIKFLAEMSGGNMRTAEMGLMQVINLNHGSPTSRQVKRFLERSYA